MWISPFPPQGGRLTPESGRGCIRRIADGLLRRLADLIMRERETLALMDSLDMGKPVMDAWNQDIPGAAGIFRYYGEAADKVCGEIAPTEAEATALILREPIGVVGAVVPWNYPLDMMTWKCAPALAAGCCVVLKPAEQSPLSALRFAELTAEAGIPPGVFNVVPGYGETAGAAIGRHMGIDCVAFTGSTEVGKKFLQYAGGERHSSGVAGVRGEKSEFGFRRRGQSGTRGGGERGGNFFQSGGGLLGELAAFG